MRSIPWPSTTINRDVFRIDFPFTDAYLLLTPRLGGWSRYTQLSLLVLVLGVVLYLLFRLYRHELKLIPRRFTLALLALRLALVASLSFVVGLKPSLARTVSETVPSKVLVAVDRSDSMSITDAQRSAPEKLELARGLKYSQDPGQIDALTRNQIAERVLSPDVANLLNSIGVKHLLDAIQFTQQTCDLPREWDKLKPVL